MQFSSLYIVVSFASQINAHIVFPKSHCSRFDKTTHAYQQKIKNISIVAIGAYKKLQIYLRYMEIHDQIMVKVKGD